MLTSILILAFVFNVALGAIFGRMDGGGVLKTPEWVERSLIMLYFVAACVPFAGWWALAAYAGVAGIATGHGLYFLARQVKATEGERFDFIVRQLFGRDPRTAQEFWHLRGVASDDLSREDYDRIQTAIYSYGRTKLYWRCVFGMFVTGQIVGLPAAILAACFGAWIPAALFLGTGLVKAVAYVVSYEIWGRTEPAEYINGGGRTALAVLALYIGAAAFLF